jgi:endonuclease/exonuclease/phosphatase family metal-dependent hydrolase
MNDFTAWLEHTRGTHQYFAPAADRQFGNLLVSRVQIESLRTLPLPKGDGSMRRSAIVAKLATPDGTVTVIAVHLQHRNSNAGINARALELQQVLREWADAPRTIILGDFNANNQRPAAGGPKVLEGPDQANTLQPLLDAGFTTTQSTITCTAPTSNDNCSDFVLITPDLLQEPPVLVVGVQPVSDHQPVVSSISARPLP